VKATDRFVGAVLAATMVLGVVPHAFADAASDAKDLFTKGRELRAAGNCKGAVPLFRKAYQLLPAGLGSLRNLAECEESLNLHASARRDWLDLKRAVLLVKDAKYDGWDADADAAAARLAPKVSRLTIVLVDADDDHPLEGAALEGLTITVGGESLDRSLVGTELDRDPGTYAIKVEGGKTPAEQSVTLATGEKKSVKLAITHLPGADVVVNKGGDGAGDGGDSKGGDTLPPRDTGATGRTFGWIGIGVAGAAAIGTLAFVFVRSSALSQVESKCPKYQTQPCGSNVKDDVDRGKLASTMVDVFGGVAIVAGIVGVTLVLTNPKPSSTSTTSSSLQVSPLAGYGAGGAMLSGSF
jgi:hypothetical protein